MVHETKNKPTEFEPITTQFDTIWEYLTKKNVFRSFFSYIINIVLFQETLIVNNTRFSKMLPVIIYNCIIQIR